MKRFSSALILMGMSLSFSQIAVGQSPAARMPSGDLETKKIVPSLFVMNAHGAALEGNVLTLSGIAPNAIVFADRPVRAAGHVATRHLIEEWDTGNDSFAKNPPNATVAVLSNDASYGKHTVVVLKNPRMEGNRLQFDVDVLDGDLTDADGPAAIFIDIIGMPWTPDSYAGMARRAARRSYLFAAAPPFGPLPPPMPLPRPTPTPTPAVTPTPTPTPNPTLTPSPTPNPTPTPSATPTPNPSPRPTPMRP